MVVNTVGILNNIVDNYKLDYHSSHWKNGNMFMLNMHGYSLLVGNTDQNWFSYLLPRVINGD